MERLKVYENSKSIHKHDTFTFQYGEIKSQLIKYLITA